MNGSGIFNRNTTVATDPDTVTALTGGPRLQGDYNDDGIVDAADYTVWRNAMAGNGALANETASLGTVDEFDYLDWKSIYGGTLSGGGGLSSTENLPEPSSFALLAVATIILGIRRRRA